MCVVEEEEESSEESLSEHSESEPDSADEPDDGSPVKVRLSYVLELVVEGIRKESHLLLKCKDTSENCAFCAAPHSLAREISTKQIIVPLRP